MFIQKPVSACKFGKGLEASPLPVWLLVASKTVCKYGMPFKKISGWSMSPRFGTLPNADPKASFSLVKFNSRIATLFVGFGKLNGGGGNGETWLKGRKMVLKPVPAKVWFSSIAKTPRGGSGVGSVDGFEISASSQ